MFLSVFICFLYIASSFANGGRIGNGGGAWVCRWKDGSIRWIELVDLYEAQHQYGLSLQDYRGSYRAIVDQIKVRLESDSPEFSGLSSQVDSFDYLDPRSANIVYQHSPLARVNDSLYETIPPQSSCEDGHIDYEQIVYVQDTGAALNMIVPSKPDVFVVKELFDALPERSKAALVIHEGLYAFMRDGSYASKYGSNSVFTRRVVGLAFSRRSDEELKKAFEQAYSLGKIPAGILSIEARGILKGTFSLLTTQSILFQVVKPDGSFVWLPTVTDAQGHASVRIPEGNDPAQLYEVFVQLDLFEDALFGVLPNAGFSATMDNVFNLNALNYNLKSSPMCEIYNDAGKDASSSFIGKISIVCTNALSSRI